MTPKPTSVTRTLRMAKPAFEHITQELSLTPYIANAAKELFRTCATAGLVKGKAVETSVCAAIYLVAKKNKYPLDMDKLAKAGYRTPKDIRQKMRLIRDTLQIRLPYMHPLDCLSDVYEKLNPSPEERALTEQLLSDIEATGLLAGKNPCATAAAAALYSMETQRKKTIHISTVHIRNTTRSTIREHCTRIKKWREG